MRLRPYKPEDASMSNDWRKARKVPAVPEEALPKTGSVCLRDDGTPIAMAWLYLTNSKMTYFAWPVTSPQAAPREAKEALTLLIVELHTLARVLGFSIIFSTSTSRGLTKLLLQSGMHIAGEKHDMLSMEVK